MKNIKHTLLAATALALSFHAPSFAQTVPVTGWYAGGSVGQSSVKPDIGPMPAGMTEEKTGVGFKIVGGYKFNTSLAVEAQYQRLDKHSFSAGPASGSTRDQGVSLAAVGFLPIDQKFSLIGKAGISARSLKLNAAAPGMSLSESKVAPSILVGFGVQYNLTPKIALRAEYEYFGPARIAGTKVKSELISAGVLTQF